jgi:outer membrane biosynthesis protein TonB
MSNMSRYASTLAALSAAVTFAAAMPAFSQAPTDAQRSAIRSACRSDFIAHCSSVQPGGREALECLQKNMSSLSSGCQSAVRAIEPPAEPKAEAKPEAAPEAKPEAPAAATAAPAEKPAAETAAKPAPKAAAAPEAAPATSAAKKPTDAQRNAVRSACRNDYMANCSSVTPGGAAAMKCLVQHEAGLSAKCKQAVNAIAAGGAPAAAGAPADAASAPGAAPAVAPMVLRPMMPREVFFVLRSGCGLDARALCAGVPPGGGRIAQCLASQAASLSPECTRALAPFAQ